MDTVTTKSKTLTNPGFTLSPRQEELLFAALNSNKAPNIDTLGVQSTESVSMPPTAFTESPVQAPGSGTLGGFEESPFIDYDYEFDADGSFDYDFTNDSQGQMIGKLPGSSSDGDGDGHDKRSHPDDDAEDEEGGGKRREGDDKSSKKPGRKPLTSEPTSKRKAQNRAAQRAFRERKEKHLKDLETKVEDLEKASESANHENSILRAQIEKMSMELREYRKRVSITNNGRTSSLNNSVPSYLAGKGLGNAGINNPNDVSFQFEFPKFGRLPGPSTTSIINGSRQSASPPLMQSPNGVSPRNQSLPFSGGSGATDNSSKPDGGDMSSLSGLFSPSLLDSVNKTTSPFEFLNNSSRSSTDSNGQASTGHNTSYSSPSASSNNNGPSSSCGTSPEPSIQSPVHKAVDNQPSTVGEDRTASRTAGEKTFCEQLGMACGNPKNPVPRTISEGAQSDKNKSHNSNDASFDINGIDWFAQQNGNQFDPQLFGDYREPQENILSTDAFNDSFFSDAFPVPDFSSPFNMAPSPAAKKDLVSQMDKQIDDDEEVVPGEDTSSLLNCHTIWDRLQQCPKVQEGNFDLDGLCSDLKKKAKCSESGPLVDESDFAQIMTRYKIENKE
ncbi:hypothetical protein B7494_g1381 [Chlorociboria aeruginascens]|nr:hypothetical protein B7494_g1381 [Chlorociboria aeruginascens]